jgi:flavin reductase (DIM6/NTAB) family NADH-FMN oxidoreductase RutF
MAQFDMRQLGARERYNLTTGTVVPRPIALVTTKGLDGRVNAAPFSYFNTLGSNPPIVAFSPGMRNALPPVPKDTRDNVLSTGEFVVNMVTEALIEAMTIAAADFPDNVSEVDYMGVTLAESRQVSVPRIVESPVNMECKFLQEVNIGLNKVIFGEIVEMHIADYLIDQEKMYIHFDKIDFVGRMPGGSGVFSRTTNPLIFPRLTYQQIMEGKTIRDLETSEFVPEEVETTQRLSPQIDALMNMTPEQLAELKNRATTGR